MTNINDVISKRRYFFSQPVQRLFEHLIYREVPELPGFSNDRINTLYENFDSANDVNRSFAYHQQIVFKTITLIKEPTRRYQTDRAWSNCTHKRGLLRQIMIWQYINRAVIVRLHEPVVVDDIKFCFKYMCFDSIYEYLEFEKQRGTNLSGNEFLRDLSDEYNFDLWFVNKLFNRAELKNEQRISQTIS